MEPELNAQSTPESSRPPDPRAEREPASHDPSETELAAHAADPAGGSPPNRTSATAGASSAGTGGEGGSGGGAGGGGSAGSGGGDPNRPPREGGGRSRVLHARISEELHQALSRAAAELRVPMSNLVRNALEDTVTLVDNMSVNVRHFVGRAMKEAGEVSAQIRQRRAGHPASERPAGETEGAAAPLRPELFAHVAAWQPAILHSAQQCSNCGSAQAQGTRIYSGIPASGPAAPSAAASGPIWLCRSCFWRLR